MSAVSFSLFGLASPVDLCDFLESIGLTVDLSLLT